MAVVWAIGTVVATFGGPVALAVWLAPCAAAAAAQSARSWRRDPTSHPLPAAAFLVAAVIVLGSAVGVITAGVVGGVAAVVVTAWMWGRPGQRRGRDLGLTLTCAALPAVASAGPVLLRGHGLVAALVVIVYALVYDAGAWVIGSDARRAWVGPAAGVACIGSVTLAVAALFPQFRGVSAWELGGLAAVLAPLGPRVAGLVVGDPAAAVPALARLDSLLVLGPVWALAVSAVGG